MESIDSLRAILHEIRPQLIKCIHDKKVKEYIEQYEQLHDGKKPNRKKIDDFNNILIAQKISVEEADKTIEECLQEVEKQIRKEEEDKSNRDKYDCIGNDPQFSGWLYWHLFERSIAD